jgi:hypothetical protein
MIGAKSLIALGMTLETVVARASSPVMCLASVRLVLPLPLERQRMKVRDCSSLAPSTGANASVNQKDTAKMAVPYLGADGAAPSKMFRCNRARTEYALRIVTTMRKTKVAVVGASGYAGEELMRLCWRIRRPFLLRLHRDNTGARLSPTSFRAPRTTKQREHSNRRLNWMPTSTSIQVGANLSCMRAISQKITWRSTKAA